MADPPKNDRERLIRTRNRALLIVLVLLVVIFYAIAMVRVRG
jgi:ABC-type transporter Mla maintaining outer membrane lipid asymmetry permease subunit MlaE